MSYIRPRLRGMSGIRSGGGGLAGITSGPRGSRVSMYALSDDAAAGTPAAGTVVDPNAWGPSASSTSTSGGPLGISLPMWGLYGLAAFFGYKVLLK